MTAAISTPLQSKFGPIVADAAGTITVQEASDVLDYSRFRVCELLNTSSGRVLVTDVLALKSSVPPMALEAPPAPKLVRETSADAVAAPPAGGAAKPQPVRHYSDPNRIQAFKRPRFGYAQKALTLSVAPASATAAETTDYSHP